MMLYIYSIYLKIKSIFFYKKFVTTNKLDTMRVEVLSMDVHITNIGGLNSTVGFSRKLAVPLFPLALGLFPAGLFPFKSFPH